MSHIYFEPVCPHIHVYHAPTYLKSYKFFDDTSIAKGLSIEDMFKFSDISYKFFLSSFQ